MGNSFYLCSLYVGTVYIESFREEIIMITGTATLIVDLGNSETRVKTYFGKTAKGHHRVRLACLSNRYSSIRDEARLTQVLENPEYTEENSRIFNMDGDVYCNGRVCEAEFNISMFRPTAGEKKYRSLSTKVALRNALMLGYEHIASMEQCTLESINVDWNMTLLLPPQDLEVGAEELANMAKSIKELDFIMPEFRSSVRVNNVTVFPEGYCALMGVIFKEPGVIREEYKELVDPDVYTLIADIGAGTTDLNLALGGKVISNARYTCEYGGNNVVQRVRRMLRTSGYTKMREDMFQKACETGFLKMGTNTIDIRDKIDIAKAEVATQLVNAIKDYMELGDITIQDVSYLLVCGGGSEVSAESGMRPISDYMVEYLQNQSSGIKQVALPSLTINGEVRVAPRLMNIIGAGILTEAMM